jgi:hypothetical protein
VRQALDANGAAQLVRSSVTFERFFFVTAYIMRNLKEADALTLDVIESSWPVVRFASIKPPPHRKWFAVSYDRGQTWRQPLEQHYDLARPNAERLKFPKLCDRIVHHFAFEVRHNDAEDRVDVLFNSDRTKDRLYVIALPTYAHVVEEVAHDEVRWIDMDQAEGRVIQRRQRPAQS